MHTIIVGNGISGITAARWIRKLSDHKITVISSESEHFYSRTALMYIYMGHMRYEDTKPYEDWFWLKNKINLKFDHVTFLDFTNSEVVCSSGDRMHYDQLILALGSKSNKFGWPGQDLNGVSGLYSLQDLEEIEKFSEKLNRAVIVGGGLIGIELAEMFHSRKIPVTMLVREQSYWDMVLPRQESEMITNHIRSHHIDLRLNTNLKEIHDDGNGRVSSVVTLETEETIPCGYVGLTPGVSPNIGWLKDTGLDTQKGILVDEFLQTNVSNVYAIGDCAELRTPKPGRRGVEAIWYTGRMMGETCAYNVCGQQKAYDPGIWFNSAKFFDIEYQVYGDLPAKTHENHNSLYWENSSGEKSVRINYDIETSSVVGFNLMGIRFRQEVCTKWIQDKSPIESVLRHLNMANFDPELYKELGHEIVHELSKQAKIEIESPKKYTLDAILNFLNS